MLWSCLKIGRRTVDFVPNSREINAHSLCTRYPKQNVVIKQDFTSNNSNPPTLFSSPLSNSPIPLSPRVTSKLSRDFPRPAPPHFPPPISCCGTVKTVGLESIHHPIVDQEHSPRAVCGQCDEPQLGFCATRDAYLHEAPKRHGHGES